MALTLLELLKPLTDPNAPVEPAPPPPHVDIPEEIIAEARVEATAIVAEAYRSASELMDHARTEAESMREIAKQEGRREGEAVARTEVEEQLRVELDVYREDIRQDLQEIVDCIVDGRQPRTDLASGLRILRVLEAARGGTTDERVKVSASP